MTSAYTLRRDIGPFQAGTPVEVIREHPNGAVGVVVNGNAFTVWTDDLAPAESAAQVRELPTLLAHLREVLETAQHSLLHARDGGNENVDVIAARGFLSMALDAIYASEPLAEHLQDCSELWEWFAGMFGEGATK